MTNAIQRAVEDFVTNGAASWASQLAVASQLPGRIDGPADAYRHLLISSELHRVFSTPRVQTH